MATKKIVLDTKKPLGNPNGIRLALGATLLVSIAAEIQIAPQAISTQKIAMLIYPLLINIIPLAYICWKWINLHLINYKIYKKLMRIVHSEQLIDYADKKETTTFDERRVEYGVKIIYKETSEGIYLTFYPNGIKHSDAIQTLNSRLEETFNMSVLSVDHQLSYTRYLLRNIDKQQMEVTDDAF